MFPSESPFFEQESDTSSSMLANYYNQLNRFPFLPLSSSLTAISASLPNYNAPLGLDAFERNFPSNPMRRLSSSSSTSSASELCLPTSSLYIPSHHPTFTDMDLTPSPTSADLNLAPLTTTSTPPVTSMPSPVSPVNTQAIPSSPGDETSSSTAPTLAKKPRAPPRERISTKDFKPPDVTGLTKREARLVKNRAAAFLSRQRKREEFETMEVRVAELERENARLLSQLSSNGRDAPFVQDQVLRSEVSTMRSKLAVSEQRAESLREELAQLRSLPTPTSPTFPPSFASSSQIKKESFDLAFDRSPSPTSSDSSGNPLCTDKEKTRARLGLMVLLSLSSLFSNSSAGSKFTLSTDCLPQVSPTSDDSMSFDSMLRPEWELGSFSDFSDAKARHLFQKAANDESLLQDAEFDVSFTTSPEDGKIRVRLSLPSSTSTPNDISWDHPMLEASDSFFSFDLPQTAAPEILSLGSSSSFTASDLANTKKRLRICLKNNAVNLGKSCGEWDVEVC